MRETLEEMFMGKRIGAFLLAALLLLCAVPSYAQELILEEPVLEEPVRKSRF